MPPQCGHLRSAARRLRSTTHRLCAARCRSVARRHNVVCRHPRVPHTTCSNAGRRHATSVQHAAAVWQAVASKSGTSLPGGTIQPHGDAEHSDSGPQTTGRCNPLPHAWMAKARQRITLHLLCSGLLLPAATTPPWRMSNPTATKLAMVAPTLCSRL